MSHSVLFSYRTVKWNLFCYFYFVIFNNRIRLKQERLCSLWVFLAFPSDSGALMSSEQPPLLYGPLTMQEILFLSMVVNFFRKAMSLFLTLQILSYYQGIKARRLHSVLYMTPLVFLSTMDKSVSFTQYYQRMKDSKQMRFPVNQCFSVNQYLLLKS